MRHFTSAVALVCGYETLAILSRRLPTVSKLCARKPALIPAILGGLAVHLVYPVLRVRVEVKVGQ